MSTLKPCIGPGEKLEPYRRQPNWEHDARQAVRAEQALEEWKRLPWYVRLWEWLRP